jgi:anti-sigma factor RsiW
MIEQCGNLDAYLADDLPVDVAERFVSHLPHCEECRAAVDQQRWIDGLLQSAVREELEQIPCQLLDSLRVEIREPRQRSRRAYAYWAVAAAAIVGVALGWINLQHTRTAAPRSVHVAQDSDAPRSFGASRPKARPAATFSNYGQAIAVELESPAENVSVVQLYPTTAAERESLVHVTIASANGG